ncbi:MAG: CZB domain-containing protein [Terriglobales bacterium]|jgi:methyl-accepting chemotaxis protein
MNFDQAIGAHSEWKHKLSAYLVKHDGSLKVQDISPDNKCPLGQWIHGEGAKYANMAEYSTLKSEHARFHLATAEVIRKADSGQSVTEETAIGAKSKFAEASSAVVTAIMAMKAHAGK